MAGAGLIMTMSSSQLPSKAPKLILVALLAATTALRAEVRTVGPGRQYATPCQAVAAARDGDIIEIDASGDYSGDVCAIYPNNLTLRGVGGRARIDAAGRNAQGKGIWVIYGNNTLVENIEFSGANVPDNNGAGIRLNQGPLKLTVRNCYFHDNEMGILTGNAGGEVVVEYCEFVGGGNSQGLAHNIYIGHVDKFIFRFNYSHDSVVGHTLKSRAAENHILYNWISTSASTGSYEIDLPNGGLSYVIGNVIVQGRNSENSTMLSYLAEGRHPANPSTQLYVLNNTFSNEGGPNATFVRVMGDPSPPVVANNIFGGGGTPVSPPAGVIASNLASEYPGFVNPAGGNYRLRADSPAVDAGTDPAALIDQARLAAAADLEPRCHYLAPQCGEGRILVDRLDIGAFEFGGRMPPNAEAPARCHGSSSAPAMAAANSASGMPDSMAAGSIVSLYGEGLAGAEAIAQHIPLPRELVGVRVVGNGAPLPLFYVGPRQINAQLPVEAQNGKARLTVIRDATERESTVIDIVPASPGIYLYPYTDRAVAANQDSSLNSAENPAAPGSVITLYLTGHGATQHPVSTGEAAPDSPLSWVALPYSATVGGRPAAVQFLGLAPRFVGVGQANVYVPEIEAGFHEVVITIGGVSSNRARVYIGAR